jgi:ribosomal protein L37AE/L43A
MIETVSVSRYPRRQWPACPQCGSRETVKAEAVNIHRFQCEACHYQWAPPRESVPRPGICLDVCSS